MKESSLRVEEMDQWAISFIKRVKPENNTATIIALSGDLGAGKTTITQGIARALGVKEIVISPTFVIEKIYQLHDQPWRRLVHIDAYRLHDIKELSAIGWDEIIIDPRNLVVIEWPVNISAAIPNYSIKLSLSGHGETRAIKTENNTGRLAE